jgi:hypothetical protein
MPLLGMHVEPPTIEAPLPGVVRPGFRGHDGDRRGRRTELRLRALQPDLSLPIRGAVLRG